MESQAEVKRSECVREPEVSGERENVEMVTGESIVVGKVMDSTGVAIEVLCGLGELGKNGEVMGETSELGEAGEKGDMAQTGEQCAAGGEVGQVTGERGVLGIVAGELGEGGMSTAAATDTSDQEYRSDGSELSNTVADSERDDLYPPTSHWIKHRAASDLTDPEIFRLKKHMGKARKQLRELSNRSTSS
ncbi:hypothetical protein D4764_04G0013350 [Takifugu flavidus]|uniref:Uncharacterized protein n=1 Tax=Takifugu flavidus TaxID=433684 RepID=A0A5C6N7G6_9TELE|nr:hypothetical protein D4764_04G0013350 [Takifugu flavidus]